MGEFEVLIKRITGILGIELPPETYDLSKMTPEQKRQILNGIKKLNKDLKQVNKGINKVYKHF